MSASSRRRAKMKRRKKNKLASSGVGYDNN